MPPTLRPGFGDVEKRFRLMCIAGSREKRWRVGKGALQGRGVLWSAGGEVRAEIVFEGCAFFAIVLL